MDRVWRGNYDNAQAWLDNLHNNGGAVYSADFKKHYEKHFMVNGVNDQLRISIKRLRSTSKETALKYYNLDPHCDHDIRFGSELGFLERSIHMIYMLQQKNILYRPIVRYNFKQQHLRLVNGSARVICLYHKTNSVPVIYNHYGDSPFVELSDMKKLNTAQEILDASVIDGSLYDEEFAISVAPIIGGSGNFEYINFSCAGQLNLKCQIEWQEQTMFYWDLVKQFDDEYSAAIALTSGSIEKDFKEW